MDDIVYSNNPNEGTVQAQIEGKYRKVTLTRAIDNTADILYQDNPNVGKVLFTGEDGKKHTATLVMDINGGSDQHNLGWYATQSALETAHPTAEDGDWAIVGATDTVWVWDSDTNAWKDTDQKGQVTSVNGQTGAVSLDINDVAPTQTGKSGYVLGTDGFVAGWVVPEKIQRSALPQASEEEVGKIYQYIGATDANYTNGYFYKCVSDGQPTPTYSWTEVQLGGGSSLPDQTGQAGKFLTTDGTDASWGSALPLSGGTMEGDINTSITFQNTTHYVKWTNQNNGAVYKIGAEKDGTMAQIRVGDWCLSVNENYMNSKAIFFGSSSTSTPVGSAGAIYKPLENVYTKYITAPNGSQITIPTTGGTLALQTVPATMPTLAVADWSLDSGTNKYTQSVSVTGVTGTNTVFVSPAPSSAVDYASSSVLCISQTTDSLTFQADSVPSNAITINIVIMGA